MKKNLSIALIAVLLISTAVFFGLWRQAKNDRSDIHLLAQTGASESLQMFEEYQKTGGESSYWEAVAAFRSFEQTYYLLVEDTNKQSNYTFCNEVYGRLILSPEQSQSHMEEIIDVMTILANDVTDENGFLQMSDLRNNIQE